MQKLMRAMHKNEKGFTLVELMVVVVIIGILVAIAIPLYGAVQTNAANRAHEANVRILIGAANMLIADTPPTTTTTYAIGDTPPGGDLSAYVDTWPVVPLSADLTAADGLQDTGDCTAGTAQNYTVTITPGAEGAYPITVAVVN